MSALDSPIPEIDQESDDAARADRFNYLLQRRQGFHRGIQNGRTMALRARGQVIQEQIAAGRHDVAEQQLELNKMKADAEIRKQQALIQLQAEHTRQVTQAFDGIKDISFDSPDFIPKVTALIRDNPLVVKDPLFENFVKIGTAAMQTKQAADQHIREHAATQKAEFGRINGVDVIDPLTGQERTIEQMKKVADADFKTRSNQAAIDAKAQGLEPSGVTVRSPDGSATFTRPTAASQRGNISASALSQLQKLNSEQAARRAYQEKETDPVLWSNLQKDIDIGEAKLQAWHDTYKPADAPPAPVAPAAPGSSDTERPPITPQDQQALDWAASNPDDPRADQIRKLHGQ